MQELAAKHGFKLTEIPVDHPGQEQKSQWLQIRRERPDFVLMWGWGVMNQVAIQEAANINYPMDHFIGIWWSGSENDVIPAGAGANGYKALNMNRVADFPVYQDIQTYVVDKGLAAGAGDQIGSVLYSRGMYAAMLAAEAAAKAQELAGHADITAAEMRDGMEALSMTSARMAELGMPDIGPEFSVSCANHGGVGQAYVQQWDAAAQQWNVITDLIASDRSVIDPLVVEDAAAYAAEAGVTPACN